MLRVGIDMDGVVADFRSAFREAAGSTSAELRDLTSAPGGPLTDGELKHAWNDVSSRRNWWTSLRPCEPPQIPRLYARARQSRWEVFFLTRRPPTAGDSVQFQTQWWLEQHGYYLPAVLTVPGSRGEIANALRLDVVVDDQPLNCVEVISASAAKALLVLRDEHARAERERATDRGIGVVATLEEALNVLERLQEVLQTRRGKLLRLTDWFPGARSEAPALPLDPRAGRKII